MTRTANAQALVRLKLATFCAFSGHHPATTHCTYLSCACTPPLIWHCACSSIHSYTQSKTLYSTQFYTPSNMLQATVACVFQALALIPGVCVSGDVSGNIAGRRSDAGNCITPLATFPSSGTVALVLGGTPARQSPALTPCLLSSPSHPPGKLARGRTATAALQPPVCAHMRKRPQRPQM